MAIHELRLLPDPSAPSGEGDVRVFSFRRGEETLGGFALEFEGAPVAFVNRCPHWNVDLDLGQRRFWSARTQKIMCANHGALFHPINGRCEWGPCIGRSLESLFVRQEGEVWIVTLAAGDLPSPP